MDQLIANLRAAVKPGLFGGRCNINAVIRIINWDGDPRIPPSSPLQHTPSLDTLENKLCMNKTELILHIVILKLCYFSYFCNAARWRIILTHICSIH